MAIRSAGSATDRRPSDETGTDLEVLTALLVAYAERHREPLDEPVDEPAAGSGAGGDCRHPAGKSEPRAS